MAVYVSFFWFPLDPSLYNISQSLARRRIIIIIRLNRVPLITPFIRKSGFCPCDSFGHCGSQILTDLVTCTNHIFVLFHLLKKNLVLYPSRERQLPSSGGFLFSLSSPSFTSYTQSSNFSFSAAVFFYQLQSHGSKFRYFSSIKP